MGKVVLYPLFVIIFFIVFLETEGQVFKNDAGLLELSRKASMYAYNWEFDKAREAGAKMKTKIPDHPANDFLEAMVLYWQNFPFDFESKEYQKHMELLETVSTKCDSMIGENPNDYEAKFFLLTAKSVMLRNWDDDGSTMKVIGELRQLYKLLTESDELKEEYVEFYLPSGLYKFYRDFYAETRPVYRPALFFFKAGNIKEGLEEIAYASKNASYSKAEAYYYLFSIYYYYLNDVEKSLKARENLSILYPNNLFFVFRSAEVLILEGQYEKAKPLIARLERSEKPFYQLAKMTLEGLMEEKYSQNKEKSWEIFQACENKLKKIDSPYADLFKTYIFVGLSDAFKAKGDLQKAREYYKLAKEFDEWGYLE